MTSTWRSLVAVSLAAVLSAVIGTPALADNGSGYGVTGFGTPLPVNPSFITGEQFGYVCALDGNPDPQYSGSNKTLHWGMRFYCRSRRTGDR